ncbi:MAG: metallophosphoesterase [Candidatus Margulisiibacteriota bacterium]
MISDKQIQNPKSKIQTRSYYLIIITLLGFGIWSLGFNADVFALSQTPLQTTPEVKTVPAKDESFSFVVFGDNQEGYETFDRLIKKVNKENDIVFAVHLGDTIQYGGKRNHADYLETAAKLKPKIYHVPGNHDLAGKGYLSYRKLMGSYYYSFDYKNSHFVVLNNAFKGSFDIKQFAWLKKDLAATDQENIFVFMHRPTFDPSEIYKNYVMSGREVVKQLMMTFEKYGVDYVFAGHIHGYAKTKRGGIVYVVTGGAGAPLYLPRDFGGFYHYVKIGVDGRNISDKVIRVYD